MTRMARCAKPKLSWSRSSRQMQFIVRPTRHPCYSFLQRQKRRATHLNKPLVSQERFLFAKRPTSGAMRQVAICVSVACRGREPDLLAPPNMRTNLWPGRLKLFVQKTWWRTVEFVQRYGASDAGNGWTIDGVA
jgi:hypothetical protein